jgi:DNA-binding MarR family transcriptional regulator
VDGIAQTLANEPCESAVGPLSELEMAAWGGFLRTHSRLVRVLDEELTREHGLPLSSYDVLVQLDSADGGRLRLSQLADAVLLSRSGLSRLVARLVDQGLVERIECESDARGAFAALTDRGRARLAEARETHRADVRRRFLDRLDDDQKRELAAVWRALAE